MRDYLMLVNKDFEDMTIAELTRERDIRKWHCDCIKKGRYHIQQQAYMSQKSIDAIDLVKAKEQYENGEISQHQYASLCGQKSSKVRWREISQTKLMYADIIELQERAIIEYIQEIRERRIFLQHRINDDMGRPSYDPRRNNSRHNHRAGEKRRKKFFPTYNLKAIKARHRQRLNTDNKSLRLMDKNQPVPLWDYNKLLAIAYDRGYQTETSMLYAVSAQLWLTLSGTQTLLKTGRLTWGQIAVIGAFFEMTPAEFADTFLKGYFVEAVDGKWVATLEDPDSLLVMPYFAKDKDWQDKDEEGTEADTDTE